MLKLSVDLDTGKPGVALTRTVKLGTTFQIALMAEADGGAKGPVEFDTLICEVLFNDKEPVVRVDPNEPPSAGELAGHSATTVDAFTFDPLNKGTNADSAGPFSAGTLLHLMPPTAEPAGARSSATHSWKLGHRLIPGYKGSTGRAGLSDFASPFKIAPGGKPVSVAAGKMHSGFHAAATGSTDLVIIANAWLGSTPVPVTSAVSKLTVVQ